MAQTVFALRHYPTRCGCVSLEANPVLGVQYENERCIRETGNHVALLIEQQEEITEPQRLFSRAIATAKPKPAGSGREVNFIKDSRSHVLAGG